MTVFKFNKRDQPKIYTDKLDDLTDETIKPEELLTYKKQADIVKTAVKTIKEFYDQGNAQGAIRFIVPTKKYMQLLSSKERK